MIEGGAAVALGLLAEPLPDLPVRTSDGQDVSPGLAIVEFGAQSQDRLGQKVVGGHRSLVFRLDFGEREGRAEVHGGVDEDDDVMLRAGQGILDPELVIRVAVNPRDVVFLEAFDEDGPGAVVAAAGVADADDQDFPESQRLILSTIRPDSSRNSISSGILPRACVAQLRQGS